MLCALAEGLQEDLEIISVDLQYTRVECAVSCACIASFLSVQEGETELATLRVLILFLGNGRSHHSLLPHIIEVRSGRNTDDNICPCLLVKTCDDEWQALCTPVKRVRRRGGIDVVTEGVDKP